MTHIGRAKSTLYCLTASDTSGSRVSALLPRSTRLEVQKSKAFNQSDVLFSAARHEKLILAIEYCTTSDAL